MVTGLWIFGGCGGQWSTLPEASKSNYSGKAQPDTTWAVVPNRPVGSDGGAGVMAAWSAARDLVGAGGTVSLFGDSLDDFLNASNLYLIDTHQLKVFPQLALHSSGLPDVQTHIELAVALAEALTPEWINLSTESNLWLLNPYFIERLDEVRDAVRAVSPATRCCVSIQYEHALIWDDTEQFVQAWPNADGIGLSSYPQVSLTNPPDMTYFGDFLDAIGNKPLLVTETSWGIFDPADVGRQVAYVQSLKDFGAKMVIYYYLYDRTDQVEFFSWMGLIDEYGQTRPAYDAFRQLARDDIHDAQLRFDPFAIGG